MIFEIEIIEPRVQKLLEELVNLNLIKLVNLNQDNVPQRVVNEIVDGLENIEKYEQGEIELTDAYDLLKELRAETA